MFYTTVTVGTFYLNAYFSDDEDLIPFELSGAEPFLEDFPDAHLVPIDVSRVYVSVTCFQGSVHSLLHFFIGSLSGKKLDYI